MTFATILRHPLAGAVRRSARVALLLALGLGFAAPALAQANLEVTVIDGASGTGLAAVPVELSNAATGYRSTQTTNSQGKARFSALGTGGSYTLRAQAGDDYTEAEASGILLRANFDSSVTLEVQRRETFSEDISVTAERQLVALNTVNAEVSSTLQERELELLPVEGRDLTRSLYRLPNVTQATGFYPEAPNVSINGANSLFTSYLIDGLDNNENFLGGQKFAVPVGAVQDVTVLTSNYSSEFGRTGNGVFNVTSRSGGNQVHGEAFYLTRPGASLDASSPFAGRDLSGNAVKDGFQRNQAGFALGGPLSRDRTFYFVNLEATRDDKDNLLRSPALGVSTTVPGTNDFLYASAKLDHRVNDSLQASLRLNLGDVQIERQGGGLDGGVTFPSAGNTQDRDSQLAALRTSFVGGNFVNEGSVQYSRFRWNYARPENDQPQVTVLAADGQTAAVLGHPGYVFDSLERSFEVQEKASFLLDNHTLKVGGEWISSDFDLAGGGNPNGNYLVQLSEAQQAALAARGSGAGLGINDLPADVDVLSYNVELRPRSFGKRQSYYSLYAEDLYSVNSRLNVTLGLRYDYDNLSQGGAAHGDRNNLAPRLAFNYRLDDKSTLRGGFGVFYDKVLYAIYSDALQQNSTAAGFRGQLQQLIDLGILPADTNLDRVLFDGNLTASFGSVPYLGGPTPAEIQDQRQAVFSNERRILNPDGYDNPVTEQYSLGYQRQLRRDLLFYVDLIHTEAYNLFRLRDLNAPAPYTVDPDNPVVRTPEEADATRPVAIVDGGARNIVVSEAAGHARYRAATFTLIKDRGRGWYNYRVSYTLSRLENDTDDINFRAQDSNNFAAEWGPSINDRTHVISGFFQVHPTADLSISVAALLQSGQPINRTPDARIFGTTDLNGDGRSFGDAYVGNSDRQPGESRNSDRLPWSRVWDLGIQYRLPFAGRKLELRADVFNLFNEVNLSGYSNNATQSNQIQIGPKGSGIVEKNAGPPRQFQFGIRYAF